MNENIDLTKILKDCPKGWKLYSTIYGDVTFLGIENGSEYPVKFSFINKNNSEKYSRVTEQGLHVRYSNGECNLFPSKDQRDWSKFTAPWYNPKRQDEDKKERKVEQASSQANERAWLYLVSDVLTWKDGIGQYLDDSRVQELAKRLCSEYVQKLYNPSNTGKNEQKSADKIAPRFKVGDWVVRGDTIAQILDIQEQYYVGLDINGKDFVSSRFLNSDKIHLWAIQDAKDGDVLVNGSNIFIFHFINNRRLMGYCHVNMDDGHFYNDIGRNECFCTIDAPVTPSTKEQRDLLFQKIKEVGYKWVAETKTLEKLIEPKFKIGDKIVNSLMKHMETDGTQGIISEITDDKYIFTDGSYISISDQDSWELVSNKKPKFDPKTLKPFDEVLVFDSDTPWTPLMFSYLEYSLNYPRMQCFDFTARKVIPYNKETEHLLGTYNEAPEYYRYWED